MSSTGGRLPVLACLAIALLAIASAACSRTKDTPLPLATVADVPLTGGATR
ncbi:MAG: hypothetical protein ACTHLV_14780 [Achromobacter mucicolens]